MLYFFKGSLVMKMQDAEMVATPEVIFGTVGGMLGVIATMNAANTRLFLEVQERLRTIVPAVGNLSHQV